MPIYELDGQAPDLPADVESLMALLPLADLYLQDEVQVALHPTLTRVWCRKGRRGLLPKLWVNRPGDPWEREADDVAARVVGEHRSSPTPSRPAPLVRSDLTTPA